MTVFFTRCCRRFDLRCAFIALWLAMAAVLPAHAQGIEIRKASVTIAEDAYVLDAQFDIALTHTLEDVLNKGVPLYFLLEFELVRSRWYWFNDRVSSWQQQHRLSYNALTRQYRLGVGNLYQNYSSLAEALEVMSRVRRRQEIDPGTLRRDTTYSAALRFRLDTSQLPKPFQLNAVGSREWYVGSDWLRWTLAP
ncbi:MAG TPA: DUF4390 domain-containing protein [Burkholderiales bacterium]|nr:DUF4390 domain-containing protein [Burkholderiales bacterium]